MSLQRIKKYFIIIIVLVILRSNKLTRSMEQKVSPSCRDDEDICEFHWSVDYMWTMVYVNQTQGYGEPVVFREGHFFRRNILKSRDERLVCDNYEKMTKQELIETPTADGQYTLIYAINREYPGPNIVVHEGQTVIVHVTNNLINEGVTIHWHGLEQRGTPYMDGVSMITQCPINPDETFTYRFKADVSGTYWYHSHHGVTRTEGLYGAIIVLPRKKRQDIEETDEDFIMLLQDRYHTHSSVMTTIQQKMLMLFYKKSFQQKDCEFADTGVEGVAVTIQALDSLVINGKGHTLNSSAGGKLMPVPLENFHVKSNTFYNFRIINSAMFHPFRVSIDNHPLTVIAVDGNDIKPITVESVIVHNGERFDVMIYTKEATKKYWIRAETLAIKEPDGITLKTPDSAYAILTYKETNEKEPLTRRDKCREDKPCLVLNCHYGQGSPDALGLHEKCLDVSDIMTTEDYTRKRPLPMPSEGESIQEIFLNFHFVSDLSNSPPAINGKIFRKPKFPILMRPFDVSTMSDLCGMCTECVCHHIVKVKKGQIVQLVLNNNDDRGVGMVHPIHLHGYTFHVLKVAYPSYETENGTISQINPDIFYSNYTTSQQWYNSSWHGNSIPGLNLVNPPLKDTIAIPKKGYSIIRFRADNPGFWFMHCHLEVHVQLGMALVLQVGEREDLPPIPQGFPACGLVHDKAMGVNIDTVSGNRKIETLKSSSEEVVCNLSEESPGKQPNMAPEYSIWGYYILVTILLLLVVLQLAYIRHLRCSIRKISNKMMSLLQCQTDNACEKDVLIGHQRKVTFYTSSE